VTTRYVLRGARIATLEDFWREAGEAVNGPGGYFGHNLDAFADCLSGGYGTPEDGDFVLEWHDHEVSRRRLGHAETARQLRRRLERAHPGNRDRIAAELRAALAGEGPTVFDWLVRTAEERAPGRLRLC
jgi:RNAse (barnase) inhibitor barstar